MAFFSDEINETLKIQASQIQDNMSENMSIRDVLAQIYVDSLENKELFQGEIMADMIMNAIIEFDENFHLASQDLDAYLDIFVNNVEDNKSCEERCNYWFKVASLVSQTTIALENNQTYEEMIKELDTLEMSYESTESYAEELKNEALEAIKNNGMMLHSLTKQIEAIDDNDTIKFLYQKEENDISYRAIITMLAYIHLKNGDFEDMSTDITIDQMAYIVCGEMETMHIVEDNDNDELAFYLLSIVGIVLIVKFISHFITLTPMFYLWLFMIGVLSIIEIYLTYNQHKSFVSADQMRKLNNYIEENKKDKINHTSRKIYHDLIQEEELELVTV